MVKISDSLDTTSTGTVTQLIFDPSVFIKNKTDIAGRGSSIRSASTWHASGSEFDPHGRLILS